MGQPLTRWQRLRLFLIWAVPLIPGVAIAAGLAGGLITYLIAAPISGSWNGGWLALFVGIEAFWVGAFVGATLAAARALRAGHSPALSREAARKLVAWGVVTSTFVATGWGVFLWLNT